MNGPRPDSRLLTSIGGLAVSRLMCRFLALLTGLLVSRILGPERLGQLAYGNMLIAFAPFLSLGFAEVLIRRAPRMQAAGESVDGLRHAVLRGMLLLAPVYIILLVVLQVGIPGGILPGKGLFLLFLVVFAGNYLYKLYYNDMTGLQKFRSLAIAQFSLLASRSVFIATFVLLLPDSGRILGMYLGMGLSFVLLDVYLHHRNFGFRGRAAGELPDAKSLLAEGAPIAFASLLGMALLVGDRLLVSRALEPTQRGLFEQAVLFREALLIVPSVLMTVMIPRYSARQGSDTTPVHMLLESLRQNQLLAVVGCVLFGIITLQLPWIIQLLLPRYVPGLPLYHWTGIAVMPLMIGYLPISYLISQGRSLHLAVLSALSFSSLLIIDGWLSTRPDVAGLAFRAVVAGCSVYFLHAMLLLWLQVSRHHVRAVVQPLLFTMGAPVYVGAVLVLLGQVPAGLEPGSLAMQTLSRSLLLLVLCSPLLWLFESRTGRFRILMESVSGRKGQ